MPHRAPARLLPLSLALATAFAPLLAQAQQATAPTPQESIELESITVTDTRPSAWQSPPGIVGTRSASATKTDTRLLHTPASVSVITQDQMKSQGTQTVAQALRYTPSAYTESRISPRYDSLFLRGFGGFGQNSNYIHHLDGQRLPRGLSYLIPNIDPWLLERIDVVRGSNSVLHGQINPGGMVNQITKRAYFSPKREIEVKAGTQSQRFVGFDINQPLGQEDASLALRLNGLYRSSTSESGIDAKRYAVAPSLTWKAGSQTEFTLHALAQRDPDGGDYNALPAYGTLFSNPSGNIARSTFLGDQQFERFDRRTNLVGYRLSHSWNDNVSLQHNLLYSHARSSFRNTSVRNYTRGATWGRIATASDEKLRGINSDVQLRLRLHTGAVRHTVNVGLDYQNTRAERLIGNGAAAPINTLNPRASDGLTRTPAFQTDSQRRQHQWGVYVQDQIEAGQWLAQLGVRHDRVRTNDHIVNLQSGRVQQDSQQRDSKTTYQAGVMYRASNGLTPYISYATSFEPTTAANRFGDPFVPTTAKQWEVGLKYQPEKLNALFTAAAFDLTRDNVLTKDVRRGADPSAQIQTGQVRVKGLELEACADWSERFSIITALTWLQPKVSRTNIAAEAGKAPVGVPRHMASLWGQYSLLNEQLKLSAGVHHVGSSYADIANTLKTPSHTLIDLGAQLDLGHFNGHLRGLTASLNVHNLTDKNHYSACVSSAATATAFNTNCFPGSRRSVVLGLNYNW